MNELARHIASLLLENDCVIIPEFGGFIAHYTPAQQMEEEHLFLPPMRVVGFNPQLRINDGLLAQSYMSVYSTTFPDAVKMIQQQAKELSSSLHETGCMELENVGELHFNIHGKYEFTPFDNRISTPDFYGLDSFKMQELKDLQPMKEEEEMHVVKPENQQTVVTEQTEEPTATIIPIQPEHTEETELKLPKGPKQEKAKEVSMLKYWNYVAGIAAVVLFIVGSIFFISPFKSSGISNTEASVLPKEMLQESLAMSSIVTHQVENSQAKPSDIKDITKENLTENTSTSTVETSTEATSQGNAVETPTPTPTPTPAPTQKLYNVIVASVGNAEAAQKAAENLIQQGYPHAKAIVGEGKARVSVESFEKEADAYRAIQQYQANGQFEAAWVLRR